MEQVRECVDLPTIFQDFLAAFERAERDAARRKDFKTAAPERE